MNALDGGWGGSRGVAGHAWRAYRGYPKPLELAGQALRVYGGSQAFCQQ